MTIPCGKTNCLVKWNFRGKPKPTLFQTSERCAMYTNQSLIFLVHRNSNKDKVLHIAHTIKWDANFFTPDRIEAVVLDHRCTKRDGASGYGARSGGGGGRFHTTCRRTVRKERGNRPFWDVQRDFNERIDYRFLNDFSPIRIPQARKLLSGDNLRNNTLSMNTIKRFKIRIWVSNRDFEEVPSSLGQMFQILWMAERIWLENIARATISVEHDLIYYITQI